MLNQINATRFADRNFNAPTIAKAIAVSEGEARKGIRALVKSGDLRKAGTHAGLTAYVVVGSKADLRDQADAETAARVAERAANITYSAKESESADPRVTEIHVDSSTYEGTGFLPRDYCPTMIRVGGVNFVRNGAIEGANEFAPGGVRKIRYGTGKGALYTEVTEATALLFEDNPEARRNPREAQAARARSAFALFLIDYTA